MDDKGRTKLKKKIVDEIEVKKYMQMSGTAGLSS